MSQWFETKVKYDKTMLDTGAIKSVTEPYLVDALSFTEAEARITKEMEPFVSGELTVTAVRKVRFEDVLYLVQSENQHDYYRRKNRCRKALSKFQPCSSKRVQVGSRLLP